MWHTAFRWTFRAVVLSQMVFLWWLGRAIVRQTDAATTAVTVAASYEAHQ